MKQNYLFLPFLLYLLFSCTDPTNPPDNGPDTTSHNFIWTIDTFGIYNSYLKDVYIIDENDIWTVGEIHTDHNSGIYNALHWNGLIWTKKKLFQNSYPLIPVSGTWPINSKDIWLAAGSIYNWDGQNANLSYLRNTSTMETIENIWYKSSNSIFASGTEGLIVEYNGQNWSAQKTNPKVYIRDIYGTPDGQHIFACGYNNDSPGTILLKKTDSGWQTVFDGTERRSTVKVDSLSGALVSLQMWDEQSVYVASSAGVYKCPVETKGEGQRLSFSEDWFPGFPRKIRGNGENDFFVVGAYYMIAHYNGNSWRYFEELNGYGRLYSVAQKGDLVVAVGTIFHPIESKAIVFTGRRIK